jgi:predicted RNA binding protein YcfA (HicA-like mRNA interferase family)
MLTSSHEIKRRLEREGWVLVRTKGSHHIFRNPETGDNFPAASKKGFGPGLGQQNL